MFIDLGEHYDDGFISLNDIAKRKDVSKKFLEQIVILYKNSDLLIGNRGNLGGYKLSCSPEKITLKDILFISENNMFKSQDEITVFDDVLKGMDKLIDNYFSSITVAQLVNKQIENYSNSYCIY